MTCLKGACRGALRGAPLPGIAIRFGASRTSSETVAIPRSRHEAPPTRISLSHVRTARAGETAAILAAAIVRTVVKEAPKQREVGLGFLPDQRVHTTPYQTEKL
jgi:hypothetical protein